MITPSFGLTATERVLPKLALDFTTAFLDSRVTFTRTTGASNPATYTNSSGLLVSASDNQPRFDYDPVTLLCKGLLIEESRQNRFVASNDLSDVVWTKSASLGYTAASGTAPTGNNEAIKLTPPATTATASVYQATTLVSGTAYTHTIYAKAGEFGVLQIASSTGFTGSGSYYRNFDLVNGVLGSGTSTATVPASITPVGNGWYRCSYTDTASGSVSGRCVAYIVPSASSARAATVTGNGSDSLYVFGFQMEAGAFATSYIPTTTTALTRNADVATMTGTNFSDWYDVDAGTFVQEVFMNFAASGTTSFGGMEASDGTTSNRLQLYVQRQGLGPFMYLNNSVATNYNFDIGTTLLGGNKIAFGYDGSGLAACDNGTAPITRVTASNPPGINQLVLGNIAALNTSLNGYLVKFSYFPQRLTNAEVQAFSK